MSETTLSIKDGGTTSRTIRVIDTSGAGTGPYIPTTVVYDSVNDVDAVGEVQATPTQYTLLRRLKDIYDAITAATVAEALPYYNLDVDETEDAVKASSGRMYWLHAMNMSNGVRYLKFYNATTANVTVGTTTPVLSFPIPTLATTNGMGFTMHFPNGIFFDTAITVAAVTGFADNSTGAPGANEVIINIGYA